MKYGIAFTSDGSPDSTIVGWSADQNGIIRLWDTKDEALEQNDLGGWTGYVREFTKPMTEPHPRHTLMRAEIRYLNANGWIMYCGVMDMWAEENAPTVRYTHEVALAMQKEKDDK
jgi:hypothetical protein